MAERNIKILVRDKKALVEGSPVIVCGNSDYSITFDFDSDWNPAGIRTARYVYVKDGQVQHQDVVFEGATAEVPVLSGITFVKVGVFEGDLCTTTPARITCEGSILCGSGAPEEPTPDVYAQIMALFNDLAERGAFGATEEQARQIEENRRNIEEMQPELAEKIEFEEALDPDQVPTPEFADAVETVLAAIDEFRGELDDIAGDVQTQGEALQQTGAKVEEQEANLQQATETVARLGEDLEATNEAVTAQGKVLKQTVEALDNRIKKFYTNNLGENHIADSDDGAFRNIVIGGNSEQVQTTGAQLFDVKNKNVSVNSTTARDVVKTETGLTFIVIPSSASSHSGVFSENVFEVGKSYVVSCDMKVSDTTNFASARVGRGISGAIHPVDKFKAGQFVHIISTFTADSSALVVYFECSNNTTGADFTVEVANLMVCEGETEKPFEIFTGGQPSPNPDYPQEINSVENATAEVNGSNLIDDSSVKGYVVVNGFAPSELPGVLISGIVMYYIKFTDGTVGDTTGAAVSAVMKDGSKKSIKSYLSNNVFTEITETDAENFSGKFTMFFNDYYVGKTVEYVMLNYGTTELPYRPYKPEQLAPIPFTLRSVGEGENAVRDVMYVYADGTGKLVQRIRVKRITTCVSVSTVYNFAYFSLGYYPIRNKTLKALSTHFIYEENIYSNARDWTFNVQTHNSADWSDYSRALVRFPSGLFTTATEVTNWLADKEVYFLYPLYEPIETTLTAEQVKALFDLMTHYGGTHISYQTENGVEPTFYGDYPCALENFVEYVKGQMGDDRKFVYDMEDRLTDSEYMSALAYVNSEYAALVAEMGV